MSRNYAVSLGALAMGLVVLRGAIEGQPAHSVTVESMVAFVAFLGIGGIAGWVMEHLLQDSIESMFRARVAWYREARVDAEYLADTRTTLDTTNRPRP